MAYPLFAIFCKFEKFSIILLGDETVSGNIWAPCRFWQKIVSVLLAFFTNDSMFRTRPIHILNEGVILLLYVGLCGGYDVVYELKEHFLENVGLWIYKFGGVNLSFPSFLLCDYREMSSRIIVVIYQLYS